MRILYPEYLVLLAALVAFFGAWWKFGRAQNTLKNTQLDARRQLASRLGAFLNVLSWTSKAVIWSALVLAFCGTIVPFARYTFEDSGVVYWAIDTSSSMPTTGVNDQSEIDIAKVFMPEKYKDSHILKPGEGVPKDHPLPTRLETAIGAIKYIAEHDTHLRMGLFAADDQTYMIYPATKDHTVLVDELGALYDYGIHTSAGDNFCGVTSEGDATGTGPTAVDFFRTRPKDEPHVLAFFSDGDFYECMAAEKQDRLKKMFEEQNVQLVVFAVGNQWGDNDAQEFIRFITKVGGHRFDLQDPKQFEEGVAFVNKVAHDGMHKVKHGDEQDSLLMLLEIAGAAFLVYLGLLLIRHTRQ